MTKIKKTIKTIETFERAKTIPARKPETVLVMRHSGPDGDSYNGFMWPESGPVSCPDWKPTKDCGNGLHGWLWGQGDAAVSDFWSIAGARWLVVEVVEADLVDLGGKVKFPRGVVVHCGDRASATKFVTERLPADLIGKVKILGGTTTAGDGGTATAGDRGTATAGYSGTATAGDGGTATAGDRGTATAGARGTATAGDGGTVKGREGSLLVIKYWDGNNWQIATGIVRDGECKPETLYYRKNGKLVEGDTTEAKEAREFANRISAMKVGEQP